MYSYTKFELNVWNRSRDNERKPFMEWRNNGMTKGNTICPRPFHGGGIKSFFLNTSYRQTSVYEDRLFYDAYTRNHKLLMISELLQLRSVKPDT
jgi:hypothetical protein